jgi:hypothetical protein
MSSSNLDLVLLPDHLTICPLGSAEPVPDWALSASFYAVVRTEEELTIVCPDGHPPPGTKANRNWRALKVKGPLALDQTGVLAQLTAPLAEAGIPVFCISTYATDYLLIKDEHVPQAIRVLGARHTIHT